MAQIISIIITRGVGETSSADGLFKCDKRNIKNDNSKKSLSRIP